MKTNGNGTADAEHFKKVLKDHDLKATPQRIAVHEAMTALVHASADMVLDYIRGHGDAGVTPSSVYNILSDLADIGLYGRRYSANSKMYFDCNSSRHLHLYDSDNHEFKDIADDKLLDIIDSHFKGRRFRGYSIDGVDIQIICHPTRKKTKA